MCRIVACVLVTDEMIRNISFEKALVQFHSFPFNRDDELYFLEGTEIH